MSMKFSQLVNSLAIYAASVCLLVLPMAVFGECAEGKLCNPLDASGINSVEGLVSYLITDILVGIIAPIVVTVMLIWSGFKFIVAQGNDQKLAEARQTFLWTIVGAAILLGGYVIYEIVINTVGEFIG